jgi:hypothetical protein
MQFTRPPHGMRAYPEAYFLLQLCTLLASVQAQ